MSDIERLMSAEHIDEWIDLLDPRLLAVTGLQKASQEMGSLLRRRWYIQRGEEDTLAKGVSRMVIPDKQLRTITSVEVDTIPGYFTHQAMVELLFNDFADASGILPLTDKNMALNRPDLRAWTMLGRAGTVGFAVFAEDLRYDGQDKTEPDVNARVQMVLPEILDQLESLS